MCVNKTMEYWKLFHSVQKLECWDHLTVYKLLINVEWNY